MVGEYLDGQQPSSMDLEPMFRGIVSAYVSLAVYAGRRDYACKMLQRMTEALNDPKIEDAIYQGVEELRGGSA